MNESVCWKETEENDFSYLSKEADIEIKKRKAKDWDVVVNDEKCDR